MRIEVAGMSREVCESCGRVSLGYVEDHYREWLDEKSEDIDSEDDLSELTHPGPQSEG